MRSGPLVENGAAWIVAHATSARFVGHAFQRVGGYLSVGEELSVGGAKDLFDLAVHFIADGEGMIIFGRSVKAYLWNAKSVTKATRIDFHKVRAQRETLSITTHANGGRIEFFDPFLEARAKSI